MIAELRRRIPELNEYYSDKLIVFFLCARRHDMDDTEKLFRRYLQKRQELGLQHHEVPHVFGDPGILNMLQSSAFAYTWKLYRAWTSPVLTRSSDLHYHHEQRPPCALRAFATSTTALFFMFG